MIRVNGNKYLLRAPLFPVQRMKQCLEGDHERWMQQEAFLYGLYLSSSELYQEFRKQEAAGELKHKMLQTLRKYWIRSSTRCTPYANFAGCAVGSAGERTAIVMGNIQQLAESCRLDMDLLHRFVDTAATQPGMVTQLKWIKNNSLYRQGRKIRYVRHELVNNKRKYFLSEVAYNNVLWQLLQRSSTGASYADLELILLEAGLDKEEAGVYIQSLIQNQLLLHELEPAISGAPPMLDLIQRFSAFEDLQPQAALLQELDTILSKDHFSIDRLQRVIKKMDEAGLDRSGVQTLFQSDLYLHTSINSISAKVLNEVVGEIEKLIRAIYPFKEKSDDLTVFCDRFRQRYEEQELPLCEVLDVELGIGYGNYNNNTASLVNDLEIPDRHSSIGNRFAQLLQQKIQSSSLNHEPVVLTDDDLDELIKASGDDQGYSGIQSAGILGSLYGKNADEIDAGNYRFFLRLINGPGGANLLGRFCHLHEDIHRMTAEITASEAALLPADTVFAEIIHLPQDRIGNILLRPVLRDYEIPFLGNSGAELKKQIGVDD
ncbi:MAG: lantibiotic dehydratase family protein, partial [Pseudobacter sp.]|uniref:lantibiotic dehydratase family protein n=1 Tax=Pseudobacter sp. TaxID=2045420 RepID=UPI003F7E5222